MQEQKIIDNRVKRRFHIFYIFFQSSFHITVKSNQQNQSDNNNDSLKLIEINPIRFNHAEIFQDLVQAKDDHLFNLRLLYEKSIQQPDNKYVPYELVFIRLSRSMAELLKEEFSQLYRYIRCLPAKQNVMNLDIVSQNIYLVYCI